MSAYRRSMDQQIGRSKIAQFIANDAATTAPKPHRPGGRGTTPLAAPPPARRPVPARGTTADAVREAALIESYGLPPGARLFGSGVFAHRGVDVGPVSGSMRLTGLHADSGGDSRVSRDSAMLFGCPVPYGRVTKGLGQPTLFRPGAFSKHLATNPDLRIQGYFSDAQIMGRTSVHTARVWETDEGLHFECTPPNTCFADAMLVSVSRGDVTGSAAAVALSKYHYERNVLCVDEAVVLRVSIVAWAEYHDVATGQQPAQQKAAHRFDHRDKAFLREMGIQGSRV